jgi:hypothetical protein
MDRCKRHRGQHSLVALSGNRTYHPCRSEQEVKADVKHCMAPARVRKASPIATIEHGVNFHGRLWVEDQTSHHFQSGMWTVIEAGQN